MTDFPTVAVVDDDGAVREALCDLLMVADLGCQLFEGAEPFVEALRAKAFDCLITDIRMPGMDGMALIEHLSHTRPELPVIVVSSVMDKHMRGRAELMGVRYWLGKPVSDTQLIAALESEFNGRWRSGVGTA